MVGGRAANPAAWVDVSPGSDAPPPPVDPPTDPPTDPPPDDTTTTVTVTRAMTWDVLEASTPPPSEDFGALVVYDKVDDLAGWGKYQGFNKNQGLRLKSNVLPNQSEGGFTFTRLWTRPSTEEVTIGGITYPVGTPSSSGISHSTSNAKMLYGIWEWHMRQGFGSGKTTTVNTRSCIAVWPDGTWPASGEFDVVERGGAKETLQAFAVNIHYSADNKIDHTTIDWDLTKWTKYRFTWTKDALSLHVNDVRKWTMAETAADKIADTQANFRAQTAIENLDLIDTVTPTFIDVRDLRLYKLP